LDALEAELLAVVDQTVQPAQAWLWLRPSPALIRHAETQPAHESIQRL
jgi:hypothetical protein